MDFNTATFPIFIFLVSVLSWIFKKIGVTSNLRIMIAGFITLIITTCVGSFHYQAWIFALEQLWIPTLIATVVVFAYNNKPDFSNTSYQNENDQ